MYTPNGNADFKPTLYLTEQMKLAYVVCYHYNLYFSFWLCKAKWHYAFKIMVAVFLYIRWHRSQLNIKFKPCIPMPQESTKYASGIQLSE